MSADPGSISFDRLAKKEEYSILPFIIISIFVIIVAIILSIAIYNYYKRIRQNTVTFRCNPGLCKFDLFTGIKTCPNTGDTQGLEVVVGLEGCTSADFCQFNPNRCALLPDQTLDCSGICGPGNSECRCINPNLYN